MNAFTPNVPDSAGSPERIDSPGVLVVDDDPAVLFLLQTALPRLGFAVWAARSGAEAVEILQQNQGHIHVALIDVRMPQPDGPQTLKALRAIDPSLPACFMTGHGGKYSNADLYRSGIVQLFDKPFDLGQVAAVLRAIADERR